MVNEVDVLIGKNAVLEALKAKRHINKIILASGMNLSGLTELLSLAKEQKVPVQKASKAKLDELAHSKKHQGVVAMVPPKEYTDYYQLVEDSLSESKEPLLIVLDEIEDPHNLGAVIRTAEAAGAQGVIIPKRRAVPLTKTVAKASAGALEYMPVARVNNLVQTIKDLKQRGFWIAGTDASGEQMHSEANLTGPLVIVIGSEGKGMGQLVKEHCDYVVKLPMYGKINSLNASVAAAVMIYEVLRQRQRQK